MTGENNLRFIHNRDLAPFIVTIDMLGRAEEIVENYSACNPESEIPFKAVIRAVDDALDIYPDYLLSRPGTCPQCKASIQLDTLVMPVGRPDAHNWI